MIWKTKCCCGCTLKTGCLIIGGLWTAGYSIFFLLYVSTFASTPEYTESMSAYKIVRIVFTITGLIASIALLFGATKQKKMLLLPYVVHVIADTLTEMIVIGILLASIYIGLIIFLVIPFVIVGVIHGYCLLVVGSYYHQLSSGG